MEQRGSTVGAKSVPHIESLSGSVSGCQRATVVTDMCATSKWTTYCYTTPRFYEPTPLSANSFFAEPTFFFWVGVDSTHGPSGLQRSGIVSDSIVEANRRTLTLAEFRGKRNLLICTEVQRLYSKGLTTASRVPLNATYCGSAQRGLRKFYAAQSSRRRDGENLAFAINVIGCYDSEHLSETNGGRE